MGVNAIGWFVLGISRIRGKKGIEDMIRKEEGRSGKGGGFAGAREVTGGGRGVKITRWKGVGERLD